jgi:germination protein M
MRFKKTIILCMVIAMLLSGCDTLKRFGANNGMNDEAQPVSSIAMNEDEAKRITNKVPIHLYFANENDNKLLMEVRYVDTAEAKKSVNNLAGIIVKELIKGPKEPGYKATIPSTTALRSSVVINQNVATVDLTKDFIDKHAGGKEEEQRTIYSIVNSLTELKEIQKVKFTINGKVQKEFKGSFKFDEPFPRNEALIARRTPSSSASDKDTKIDKSKTDINKDNVITKAPLQKDVKSKAKDVGASIDASSEEDYIEILE